MKAALVLLLMAAGTEAELDDTLATQAADAVLASSQLTTKAKPLVKTAPEYPRIDLNRGREAWVRITYCIDESGAVQNVSVLDSIGNERFDRAAIKTVEQWKFEPAMQSGKPVWQSRNNVLVNFSLEGEERGASKIFATKYRQLGRLIEADKLKAADELFHKIYETYDLNLYELAKLWAQRVRYESKVGDLYKLDLALQRATASDGEWIDKQSYIQLLGVRAMVELKLGKYQEARRSYDELIDAAGNDAENVVAMRGTFEKVQTMIDGDQILKIEAEVRPRDECAFCNNSWNFSPVRNDFTLANIRGTLKSIDMRCDNKRFESDVTEFVEWHIPKSWGSCQVHIYGEPGATFDVLMLTASVN